MKDLTGKRFGRLIALNFSHRDSNSIAFWNCICDCGNNKISSACGLRAGAIKSCGCLHLEKTRLNGLNSRTHGMTGTPEYGVWIGMRRRCLEKNHRDYRRYGGRGIKVCKRWLNSFENFLNDIGPRPSINHSIERKNNAGNYEPGNCVWATRKEQCSNRRSNRFLTIDSITRTIKQWSIETGIKRQTISFRLKNGWSPNQIISPTMRKHYRKRMLDPAQPLKTSS